MQNNAQDTSQDSREDSRRHRRKHHRQIEEEQQEITDLLDIVDQNIENVVTLHIRAEQKVSHHQRVIERITAILGRPLFFYLTLCFVALWMLLNLLARYLHLPIFDPPPFYWLQGLIGLTALLVTTAVLITQRRQARMTEMRRHLDLQVSLLIERKVTRLITMIDELRRDMPSVETRHDPQTEAMKESVNPQTVLESLNHTFDTINTDE